MALGVSARRRYVPTVTCACMAHTADISEYFSKLIDRQLTNIMVGRIVDGDQRKPPKPP